jgi:tRNA(His) guanylyltransferase
MQDKFGDRMKMYESFETGRKFMPLLPVVARIDGRSFSKFTKGLNRPYDERMSQAMINTTKRLVEATNARVGYTQSDEITLGWYSDDAKSQIFFDGRIFKMTSQLAALATLYFYQSIQELIPDYAKKNPTFDARVWQLPNLTEAANVFLWREWDATKNSVSMAAHDNFSHKQLHQKNQSDMQEMLFQKGINWNDYPDFFKRGTYVRRITRETKFSSEDIEKLPKNHAARTNPDLVVTRSVVEVIKDFPPLSTIYNRVGVLFSGAYILTESDKDLKDIISYEKVLND